MLVLGRGTHSYHIPTATTSEPPQLPQASPENLSRRIIGGIAFEAVRMAVPSLHWRVRVTETGYLYAAGCFSSESRPKLWAAVEDGARLRGNSWVRENLTAHDARWQCHDAAFVLWGFHPAHAGGQPIKISDYDVVEELARKRQGWTCCAYLAGEEPSGLLLLASQNSLGVA